MWRPDNWENGYGGGITQQAYEAGADAILPAIINLVEKLGYKRVADDLRIYCGLIPEEKTLGDVLIGMAKETNKGGK